MRGLYVRHPHLSIELCTRVGSLISDSVSRITSFELIPRIPHCEAAVALRDQYEGISCTCFVDVRDKSVRRVVFLAASHREMELPQVFQTGRCLDRLPSLWRAAFASAVIHHRQPGVDGADDRGRV